MKSYSVMADAHLGRRDAARGHAARLHGAAAAHASGTAADARDARRLLIRSRRRGFSRRRRKISPSARHSSGWCSRFTCRSNASGTQVKAGDPLFRVDDRHLQAQLALAKARAASARSQLTKLEELPRPEDVPPSEAKVQAAKANADRTRDEYERARALWSPARRLRRGSRRQTSAARGSGAAMAPSPARTCALAGGRLEAGSRCRPRRGDAGRSRGGADQHRNRPRDRACTDRRPGAAGQRPRGRARRRPVAAGAHGARAACRLCMFEPTSTSTTSPSFAPTRRRCCNCEARTTGIIRCDSCESSPMSSAKLAHGRQHRASRHARASGDLRTRRHRRRGLRRPAGGCVY